jgi:hypothetical protein
LVEHFADMFQRRSGGLDVRQDVRALLRLRHTCDRVKCALSASEEVPVELTALLGGRDLKSKMTRELFEELCKDLFPRVLKPVDDVLKTAGLGRCLVQDIILTGGTLQLPKVRQLLRNFFGGRELSHPSNATEAAALGAAQSAAQLDGTSNRTLSNTVLLDALPFPLGLETADGRLAVLVDSNSCFPLEKTATFSTSTDRQTTATICIYEGAQPRAKDNVILGSFELTGIPPAPRGRPQIEIHLSITAERTVTVTAKLKDSAQPAATLSLTQQTARRAAEELSSYGVSGIPRALVMEFSPTTTAPPTAPPRAHQPAPAPAPIPAPAPAPIPAPAPAPAPAPHACSLPDDDNAPSSPSPGGDAPPPSFDPDTAGQVRGRWTVSKWLQSLDLSQYTAAFEQAGFQAPADLILLSDADLISLGVVHLGHRRRILYFTMRL